MKAGEGGVKAREGGGKAGKGGGKAGKAGKGGEGEVDGDYGGDIYVY